MSRCRQTDAILDATFAGAGLTRDQASHATTCAECARALSDARRFEAELGRIGVDLSPEPMPAGAELAAVATPSPERGGPSMTLRRSLVGGAGVAVLLAAVVFGGGQWLGSAFGGPPQPGGIAPEDLNAWLDNALASVIDETGRGARPADWEPVQVEECGTTAIAFYAERDPESNRAYRWAVGEPGRLPNVGGGGLAVTLTDADVAAIRATLPVCSLIVDPALGEEQARDALQRARQAWDASVEMARVAPPIPDPEILQGAQITSMSPIGRDLYGVVLEYRDGTVAHVDRVTLSVTGEGTFEVQNVGSDEAGAQPLVVYRDPIFGAPTYFAFTGGRGAAAVEFIGPEVVLRYPVTGSGFMLEGVVSDDAVTEYRFLDGEGRGMASGRIEVWCRGKVDTPFPGAGC